MKYIANLTNFIPLLLVTTISLVEIKEVAEIIAYAIVTIATAIISVMKMIDNYKENHKKEVNDNENEQH